MVKETRSPTTGVSTWCAIRTAWPSRTTSTAFVGSPLLPLASQRITCLEHEAPVTHESGAYRGQRVPQLVVFDEHLERVTGHHDEVELPAPIDRGQVARHPLYVRPLPRLPEHRLRGIEPAESSAVPGFPRHTQQLARAATHVEHASRRHHEWKVEPEVPPSLAERIVQLGETGLGEEAVHHHGTVPARQTHVNGMVGG